MKVAGIRVVSVAEALHRAKKELPLGHYDIKKAQRAVEEEYAESREQEEGFFSRMRKGNRRLFRRLEKRQAERFCDFVTTNLKLRKISLNFKDLSPWAGGECDYIKREIRLPSPDWINTLTLIHELAHWVEIDGRVHFQSRAYAHGENFLWCERLVMDAFVEFFKPSMKRK